jgi:hypothetical protein
LPRLGCAKPIMPAETPWCSGFRCPPISPNLLLSKQGVSGDADRESLRR